GMMENITVARQDRVVSVRLANPPLNMLTRPMMRELHDTFAGVADDRDVRAVVLAAEGDRAFCAGLDLNRRLDGSDGEGADREPSPQELLDHGRLRRAAQRAGRTSHGPDTAA